MERADSHPKRAVENWGCNIHNDKSNPSEEVPEVQTIQGKNSPLIVSFRVDAHSKST